MWQTLSNSLCELGESPFWHPQERSLYWIDIPGRAVLRTRGATGGEVQRWPLAEEPGCIAPARRGGLVLALRSGIYRAREWGGALQLLAPADYDTTTLRFNDGKCDPLGRFWAGTLNEPKDQANATLYCLDARAGRAPVVTKMANAATSANGLGFAPDACTVYWADTAAHAVRAWDWAGEANALTRERVFHQFDMKPASWTPESGVPYQGRPDGATIDAAGDYWVAMFEGAQLLRLSPAGEVREAIALPVQCPTMPCFGGDDLRTLFVTSGRKGRPAAEIARLPASGSVIQQRVATPGLPVAFFED
ncbi:SMP-30/gluconolactonase/LRE family protein [Variovorax fucosicus]|uniref:SMP-30/gluconolactonase/LRE family protein n=1 Tax=Variovorax fucosicus TaxID=3053517 RepID=UPI002575479B|nr:SMP-30/gluconolactonase/LRE family protein [Variovorax sp. J22G47]MDM0055353.1 SMP-30/gluconolactonase/LRE family protein [Variovorax sp. J22G47]